MNEKKEGVIALVFGGAGGTLSYLVGGFDTIINALFILMLADILCGVISAALFHVSKYSEQGISSEALLKGAVRKAMMIAIIILAVCLDRVTGMNYIRNAVVMYFIATEGLSILEHAVHMDMPVPEFIKKILDVIKEENNGGGNHE